MKGAWWKIGGILCLLYVLGATFFVPLGAGVHSVYTEGNSTNNSTPLLSQGTSNTIYLQGYNTHFQDAGDALSVWLIDSDTSTLLLGENVTVESNELLSFTVNVPPTVESLSLHAYVNNAIDGTFWLDYGVNLNSESVQKLPSDNKVELPLLHKSESSFSFPYRPMLYESIRNLMLHVPMWFAMMFILLIGLIKSIKYLRTGKLEDDWAAEDAAKVGLLFGVLGIITGSIWARFTWGDWWTNDVKLNGAAITVLVYLAYMVLRRALPVAQTRGKIAAVYNIFAFCLMIVFIQVLPRTAADSLHPGNGGNPGFSPYDLDNTLRMVFYPAVIGWSILAFWIYSYRKKVSVLREKTMEDELA